MALIAAPYGTYIIDLTQPEETLWSNLHSKHRNVVRNAMKKGVEIRSGMEHWILPMSWCGIRSNDQSSDLWAMKLLCVMWTVLTIT